MTAGTSSSDPRGTGDWFSAGLVFLLIQVAALRLLITGWVPDLFYSGTLGAMGVILGLALGRSRFGGRGVRVLATGYTLVLLPLHLSGAIHLQGSLLERLRSLGGRFWLSTLDLVRGAAVEDPLYFAMWMATLFWFLGLFAGFQLTRRPNSALIVLPAGIVTLVVHSYDDFSAIRAAPVAAYLFLAIVLLGRLNFTRGEQARKSRGVLISSEAPREVQNHLILLAAAAIGVAWILPAPIPRLDEAARSWNRLTDSVRDELSNAVSALDSPYGSGRSGDFYGETSNVGRRAAVGVEPVFRVEAGTADGKTPPRYYWRGWAYDTYAAGRWSNLQAHAQEFDPTAGDTLPPEVADRIELSLTFEVRADHQTLIYSPSEPVWTNRSGQQRLAGPVGAATDLVAWRVSTGFAKGDRYEVRASFVNPALDELRAAGVAYPTWVAERYLQLPVDIAPQLTDLAERITLGRATPYDKAAAITAFLRQDIAYRDAVDAAPPDVDPVVWLLTESREGFCVHYSSAEVLLLRALGIPARYAVGFSQGEFEEGAYTVLQQDAHAWPEVYFPGIGWVEFEPTGNQPPLLRPISARLPDLPPSARQPAAPTPQSPDGLMEGDAEVGTSSEGEEKVPFLSSRAGRVASIAALMLALALVVQVIARKRVADRLALRLAAAYRRGNQQMPPLIATWAGWAALTPAERRFQSVNVSLRLMGITAPIHSTPSERARILVAVLPSAATEIDAVQRHLEASLFSGRLESGTNINRAGLSILAQVIQARLRRALSRV